MVKKKIDNRIRVMIENGVKLGHRTMFIIVGDKARDQVNAASLRKKKELSIGKCISVDSTNINKCGFYRCPFYMIC